MTRHSALRLLLAAAAAVLLVAGPVTARGLMQAPAPTVESSLPPELLQTCVITPEIAAK